VLTLALTWPYIIGAIKARRKTMNAISHVYQVIYHIDDVERVVFETMNEEEAYDYAERANHCNSDFTYSYYDVDC
jgi:hypothetical protein